VHKRDATALEAARPALGRGEIRIAQSGSIPLVATVQGYGYSTEATGKRVAHHTICLGHLHILKYLHKQGYNVWVNCHGAAAEAAAQGHLPVLKQTKKMLS
jgi:hypothetical protein